MGHIANLLLEASGSTDIKHCPSRATSPSLRTTTPEPLNTEKTECQKVAHVWRMQQPTEKKLISKTRHSTSGDSHASSDQELYEPFLDLLSPFSDPFNCSSSILETECLSNSLGVAWTNKFKEPILTRRRKISVPELGPMTTVHEDPIDSPTIPGRPPVHERSHSVPVNTCRQESGGDAASYFSGPDQDEEAENVEQCTPTTTATDSNIYPECSPLPNTPASSTNHKHRTNLLSQLKSLKSSNCDDSRAPDVPPKSEKVQQDSPSSGSSKSSPFAPISALSSAISATFSASSPVSSLSSEGRSSPKRWGFGRSSPKPRNITGRLSPKTVNSKSDISPTLSIKSQSLHQQKSEGSLNSRASKNSSTFSHARHSSDDIPSPRSNDRGRSKKRFMGKTSKEDQVQNSPSDLASSSNENSSFTKIPSTDRSASSCSLPEQYCFLSLPSGYSPKSANQNFSPTELSHLKSQALSQVNRFEILSSRDVDSLSRELRALDERCEYLRRTHHSLRAGRQALHTRICSHLRNPHVTRFSGEEILKQEESLSGLDRSIDSWVSKLEQVENRRMRVRQKLLEHVAAAALMDIKSPVNNEDSHIDSHTINHISSNPPGENTPPHSPRHSPKKLEKVMNEVQGQLESLLSVSESLSLFSSNATASSPEDLANNSVDENSPDRISSNQNLPHIPSAETQKSIRVYADDDLYALMDCVEEEIERMGM
ncbi:hypothetical protein GcC1_040017 [Golovinomyces cichoracearum]|uniref:Up-regulated during septation protein 1 domain-containing protein n=1 Tax=Golovinomyces cichoracearum TaxID=62708 RepID=A0A420IZI9_9PEZI|nr:hypothetical protein GcC1_040017 [Golovinomyces cichoracearum]